MSKAAISASHRNASVVDLFCGAGGLAHGFKLERFNIAAGVDVEAACRFPFEHNNESVFHEQDVRKLSARKLTAMYPKSGPRVLVGCAPCQPFSTYNQKNTDGQWSLVDKFASLITETKPDVVSMENVPRLTEFGGGSLYRRFVKKLEGAGYFVTKQIVFLPDYGLAQRRTRLVVLASLHGEWNLEKARFSESNYKTVREVIEVMPALSAGDRHPTDRLHCTSSLSALNFRRLQASKPGGTWRDWEDDLRAECHHRTSGKGYGAVYGRMEWDSPSPTITTQFYGFGSGRFGHPSQDRALSLREGAMLQSFPRSYGFVSEDDRINMRTIGRLIGNAVPVKLGRVIARAARKHLRKHFPDADAET